jgi:hypothetical protein
MSDVQLTPLGLAEQHRRFAEVAATHFVVMAGAARLLQGLHGKSPAEALVAVQEQQSGAAAAVAATDLLRWQASRIRALPGDAAAAAASSSSSSSRRGSGNPGVVKTGVAVSTQSDWCSAHIWQQVESVPYKVSDVAAALFITAWVIGARFGVAASGCMLNFMLTTEILFLMGAAGSLTAGFVDPAAAITYAWLLCTSDPEPEQLRHLQQQPLATWLFISPAVFADRVLLDKLLGALASCGAVPELQKKKKKKGAAAAAAAAPLQRVWDLLVGGSVSLTAAQMKDVSSTMTSEHAVLVEQKAGFGVWVPPGWLHWVYNNQACFKIAFEVCPNEKAAACCYMQRRVRSSFSVGKQEYIRVRELVVHALSRWAAASQRAASS